MMLGRQIAIGFAVALILPLLVFYGVATFHAAPKPQDYVAAVTPLPADATREERQARQEQFQAQQKSQQKSMREAQQSFARILFYVAVPLGYVAILAGGFMPVSAVGTGLIFGGIFTVIDGHWSYWSFIENWQRFVSLLVAAAIVVVIAYRKLPQRPPGEPAP